MTTLEETIKNAVLRYHREYDRYLKLSARVPKVANYIVSSSGEAVSDGVARLRWFAARLEELSKVESEGLS